MEHQAQGCSWNGVRKVGTPEDKMFKQYGDIH